LNFELDGAGLFVVNFFTDFGTANKAFGGFVLYENNEEKTLESGPIESN